jgi:hypothetical protein
VINFQNAPAYKVAQFFTEFINNTFQLPYTFNVCNSVELITDLNKININMDTRICSFDIKNMYSNIPTHNLINVIVDMANKCNIPDELAKEIKLVAELIIKQNYLEANSKFYLQSEGLAMDTPSSALLSEIYLQYIEHNHILDILKKHTTVSYHRYVDISGL